MPQQKKTTKKGSEPKRRGRPPGSKNKNTTKKSGSKNTKMSAEARARLDTVMRREEKKNRAILAAVLIAVSLFLILTMYTGLTGIVGQGISGLVLGLFGYPGYLLPFYVLILSILLILNNPGKGSLAKKVVLLTLFFILMTTFYAVGHLDDLSRIAFDGSWLRNVFEDGAQGEGGGLIGMSIAYFLSRLIGKAGAYIVTVLFMIITLILAVNKPLGWFADKMGERKEARTEKHNERMAQEIGHDENGQYYIDPKDFEEAVAEYREQSQEQTEMKEKKRKLPFSKEKILGYLKQDEKELFSEQDDITRLDPKDLPDKEEHEKKKAEAEALAKARAEAAMKRERTGRTSYGLDGADEAYRVPSVEEREARRRWRKAEARRADDFSAPDPENEEVEDFSVAAILGMFDKPPALDVIPEKSGDGDHFDSALVYRAGDAPKPEELRVEPEPEPDIEEMSTEEFIREMDETVGEDGQVKMTGLPEDLGHLGTEKTPVGPEEGPREETPAPKKQLRRKVMDNNELSDGVEKMKEEVAAVGETKPVQEYRFPPIELLKNPAPVRSDSESRVALRQGEVLEQTLQSFGVNAKVVKVDMGPSVTRFEVQPATGVKVSKIVGLENDIALNLRAKSIRMEAPIPGKAAVGIEIENDKKKPVLLREIIDSSEFKKSKSKITFAVGRDISGNPIVADLKAMPHLLIAGTTGSGKSVCINNIILSLLYEAKPDEVKLILVDPKVVEFSVYNGIPHLLVPVVNEASKAAVALSWAVNEMENRYRILSEQNVRNIDGYNEKAAKTKGLEKMPQIVIVIDELADLMMAAPKQVEDSIVRLAQKARAAGIHMIVATQRPSVDVITGLIKANIPSRLALAVSSQVDSRTILDQGGAETLVGNGDMLFKPIDRPKPVRIQGSFVTDYEVMKITDFLKSQGLEAPQAALSEDLNKTLESSGLGTEGGESDEYLMEAVELAAGMETISVSMLQRRFRIGFNRASRLMDMLEERGVVAPQEGAGKPRTVLITEADLKDWDKAAEELTEENTEETEEE